MDWFGDRAAKEVIKVKWGHKVGTPIWYDWCPYKENKTVEECELPQRKVHTRAQQKDGHQQTKEKGLKRNLTCWHLELEFPASRIVTKK